MKTFFSILCIACISIVAHAQIDNPYNDRGINFVKSLSIISNDIVTKGVKDFSDDNIKYYSGIITLKTEMTTELAANIFKTAKDPSYKFSDILGKSSLSNGAKQIISDIYMNPKSLSLQDYKLDLASKVSLINKAITNNAEKEFLLSITSIAYNLTPNNQTNRAECSAFGQGVLVEFLVL